MSINNFFVTPTFMFDVTVEFVRHKPRKGSKTKTKHFKVEAQNQAEASVRVMNKLQHSRRIARRFKKFYVKLIKFTDFPDKPLKAQDSLDQFETLLAAATM